MIAFGSYNKKNRAYFVYRASKEQVSLRVWVGHNIPANGVLVLAAVKKIGFALQSASETLKNDRDVVW